ncbi:porin [Ramlibacter solisilvae]|uniref:Porin n=1 Tax=Ramlibacter tataouinensis TaxID=94132 RepID=A0A127JU62_9BURK|nr:porin [Ramlibacter tataouinensis]AMO23445.1 porin [Ramlibacter tataouinensis]
MKKSLIALAVLAAAGAASAQSSVTLFGIVDATYAYGKGEGVGGSKKSQLTNSGYNSSRLGFRGTEDLGGGMSASFWLEAGVNNDNGAGSATNTNNQATGGAVAGIGGGQGLTFNRRSTVSLAGGWGELRLGRDYTPQFFNLTVFDPFGTNGVGTTQTLNSIGSAGAQPTGVVVVPTAVRASNSIGYFLPGNIGGFYGQAQYYMGENNDNSTLTVGTVTRNTKSDGTGGGFRVGYAAGPFNVAFSMSKTNYAFGDVEQNNVGGQWDFGFAKLMGQYSFDSIGTATAGDVDGKGWLIGGLIPVGAGEIRLSYSTYEYDIGTKPEIKKFAIGYVHNLSKRTALYTTYARLDNSGGASQALNGATTAANTKSDGFDIGIRHSF